MEEAGKGCLTQELKDERKPLHTEPDLTTLGSEPAKTLQQAQHAGVGIRRVTSETEVEL